MKSGDRVRKLVDGVDGGTLSAVRCDARRLRCDWDGVKAEKLGPPKRTQATYKHTHTHTAGGQQSGGGR